MVNPKLIITAKGILKEPEGVQEGSWIWKEEPNLVEQKENFEAK